MDELHLSCLPKATQKAFQCATTLPLFSTSPWYLAGGTALALQVGHRQSVDLDFFTTKAVFNQRSTELALTETKSWETTRQDQGTLFGLLKKAKMSLIAYPFFLPSKNVLTCGTVRVLHPSDIAVMKIIAVSQRGRKRDFLDLYWYCMNRESLKDVIIRIFHQYPQRHDSAHIIKSLMYFVDAESDPMPTIFFKATWTGIKAFFRREVPKLARSLLGIS